MRSRRRLRENRERRQTAPRSVCEGACRTTTPIRRVAASKRCDRFAWKMSPAKMYSRTRATASRYPSRVNDDLNSKEPRPPDTVDKVRGCEGAKVRGCEGPGPRVRGSRRVRRSGYVPVRHSFPHKRRRAKPHAQGVHRATSRACRWRSARRVTTRGPTRSPSRRDR